MTDLTGRTLGRYRLESLLGRGGMAEVWRATDTRLARTVAVKVIHASIAEDAQFAERFLREARVVASLEHPNILPVYDYGDEGGIPYLVMPHLAGGTLRERLRGAPAPLGVAASWIRQLADALDAAHAAGVLHRDVKPANVLLGRDDRLFLADFGIAKMVETMSGLTATGVVVGTPVYMAPEQAQGHPASPATDRYALAVVAYEILAGKPPFDGDNPLSLMHQHVSTPAPALSSKVGGLPAGLDAVFAQALSKNPVERPPACRALADAVSAFLPTGVMPVVGSAAWGTPAGGMTAPTVVQERGPTPPAGTRGTTPWSPPFPTPPPGRPATPPPVRVATPPPSLTSDLTVLSAGRRRRRGLVWGAGIAAVVLVVLGIAGKMKRDRTGASDASKVNAAAVPAPASTVGAGSGPSRLVSESPSAVATAPPMTLSENPPFPSFSSSSSSRTVGEENAAKVRAAEEKRIAELERRVKDAETAAREARETAGKVAAAPAVPAVPPVDAGPEDGAHPALAAVRERLDLSKKPDHRLSEDDFRFALETARGVAAEHPRNADARFLATYAQGGLAYAAGNDSVASALAVESVLALRRAGKADHRGLQQLLVREDGTVTPPRGWELAVVYGDARGEALSLLDAAVQENPRDLRARRARAVLRKMHGLEPDGPGARKRPG